MTEIRQLAAAIDAFKAQYKVDYIPSKLYLSETGVYPAAYPLAQDSVAYLQRIWPRLGTAVDWNGSGTVQTTAQGGDCILEGDQCLVFFLGGIVTIDPVTKVPVCNGFSTNPGNPAAHVSPPPGTGKSRPPLYEFDSNRLIFFHTGTSALFPSYLDTYGTSDPTSATRWRAGLGQPYLYFSCNNKRNGYNYGPPDCEGFDPVQNKLVQIYPYAQGVGQFLNPSGFQIISAGADMKFGPGTANPATAAGPFWTSAAAASSAASGPDGADDQSNFYDNLLGTPSIN
jgi:hypothetical protein